VDRLTRNGVVANGVEYEVDCVVYATGFEVGTDFTRRAGCELVGRDAMTLTRKWSEGASTFHGMHVHGFPNCFVFSLIQAGFTANFPHMLDEQARHCAAILSEARRQRATRIEADPVAEEEWVRTILDVSVYNQAFLEQCTPGYYNNEGKPGGRAVRNGSYGAGSVAFIRLLEQWRAEGSMPGLVLS
jgi:cyclohexanone monooxygenase